MKCLCLALGMGWLTSVSLRPAEGPGLPVKVFVLAGQSNMEGQAVADLDGPDYNEGRGTLKYLFQDSVQAGRLRHLIDAEGHWTVRSDVRVRYQLEDGPLKRGPLTLGFAVYEGQHHFGPELQFGHVVGDHFENPVLLVKTAWGGKSLYKDFRPPSSGGEVGIYYRRMLAQIRDALAHAPQEFPESTAAGCELAGFVWYQGWNDGCEPQTAVPQYETNLVNLIHDVRRDLNAPNLPFVVGELTGPWVEAPGEWAALRRAQAAAARRPEFAGTVTFVETHDFVRAPDASPNPGHGHHEFGNAETYFLVGDALAKGMLSLLDPLTPKGERAPPPTMRNRAAVNAANPAAGEANAEWSERSGAPGYPSRDPELDALPGFQRPPPGYGEVPFWWWTGDPLDPDRLIWQLDQLHQKGISGVQVNYAHEDSPGWPTYAAEPPIFSEAWWQVWGRIADECRRRGMGLGLSTYTLDWPGADNLFRRLFYSKPELNALELKPLPRVRLHAGQGTDLVVPPDVVSMRAHRVRNGQPQRDSIDLQPRVREGKLRWTAPDGDWELWLVRAERKEHTLNPLLPGVGEIVIRDFYQRFQDATPNRSSEGLNYFFNDELNVGAGSRVWNADFGAEFARRKNYDLAEVLPALWEDLGELTPKVRMDYADVRMVLMEERYFQPIYQWHASRGLIFACDSGGRGLQPDEFGDYFRATRWYTAPGHDTPGGRADLIKGKVSSSIASLYRRPRVWLEGYHSLGWGATPERLMQATRENFLYGCTLLNLHGLYYTTHGSFWEWAPPCYHFRMPYWEHLDVFLRYFDRLSYLLSQGTFVCDVAVLYPVAPFEAGLDGGKATKTAFECARVLMASGVNFEFLDADSLARARVQDGRLEVSDSSYRVLVLPSMDAVRWSSLQQAARFAHAGGLVLNVGSLPFASDRAGRDDPELHAVVSAAIPESRRLSAPGDLPAVVLAAFTPDTRAEKPVRTLHRKIGPRDVYLVMDAPKDTTVEFRAKGCVELWDPWTGGTRPLRVAGETPTGTRVQLPLEPYEAQLVVFTPGRPQVNPTSAGKPATTSLALDSEWEFELEPTMDNRHGDFRLPATQAKIGPEARLFRHALEAGKDAGWERADFDDQAWERVTYDFGPQFWVLGPLPAELDFAALETELRRITRIKPGDTVTVAHRSFAWRPYNLSWREGLEGDPGHQGWHGLKENVTDHFLCLGKRAEGLNELKYEAEIPGGRYYLWTSATVAEPTQARLVASSPGNGERPHASEVLTPAAVYLNGVRLDDWRKPVTLGVGANPLLVRFDGAGRGYVVVRREEAAAPAAARTPLAMSWFDDPALIRLDVHAGVQPAAWFRFVAPPGLRAFSFKIRGEVQAWVNGRSVNSNRQGRVELEEAVAPPAVVALRVRPETGFAGGAVFQEPVLLECGPGLLEPGDWSKVGALECYSGGAWYRRVVTLTPEQARGEAVLDLGKVVATAEVRVNGAVAGIRVAPPWRVDLGEHLRSGTNRIEVRVFNTLANHYRTVPTRYRGEATSGMLGPVRLEFAGREGGAAQIGPPR